MGQLDKLRDLLAENLKFLNKDSVVLVKAPVAKHIWVSVATLDALSNVDNIPGVYISLGKPHMNVRRAMEFNGYDTSRITFVDTIGRLGGAETKGKRVIFLDGPFQMDLLMNTISRGFVKDAETNNIPLMSNNYFLIDNMDEMLIYNTPSTVSEFLVNFISLIKKNQKMGLILFHNEENPIYDAIKSDVDHLFYVKDEWF